MTNPHTESFDTRLDEILDTFIAVYKDTLNGRDNRTHNTAKQAIRELVLSEIGHNTATYHDHPFLSDYSMGRIHIAVNDMMLYDKTQHFRPENREWFEKTINSAVERQMTHKCENTLRDRLKARINGGKDE